MTYLYGLDGDTRLGQTGDGVLLINLIWRDVAAIAACFSNF